MNSFQVLREQNNKTKVTSIMPLHPQGSRGVFGELKGSSAGFGFVYNVKLLLVNLQMYACVHVDLMDGCAFGCPVTGLVCPCVHPGMHMIDLCAFGCPAILDI